MLSYQKRKLLNLNWRKLMLSLIRNQQEKTMFLPNVTKSRISKSAAMVVVILVLILGFQSSLIAQDTLGYKQVLELALSKNFSIKLARNKVEITSNDMSLGNAGFLPQVNLNARRSKSTQDTDIEFIDGRLINTKGAETTQLTASLDLTWKLFDGTRMFIEYNRLGVVNKVETEVFRTQLNNSLSEISVVYHQVIRLKESLDLMAETIQISRERLSLEENKLLIGTGSELEVYQAKTDLNADSSAWMRQKIQYQTVKNQFSQLLDLDLTKEVELGKPWENTKDWDIAVLLKKVDSQNPELNRIKLQERENQLAVRSLQAQYLPELDFNMGYTYNDQQAEASQVKFLTTSGLNYNFTARLNLFQGFNQSRKIENAKIQSKNNALQYNQMQAQLNMLTLSTWQARNQTKAMLILEQSNFGFAQKTLAISKEKYNQGLISAVEFRETQRNWLNAQLRLLNAEFDVKLNDLELMRLSGAFVNN